MPVMKGLLAPQNTFLDTIAKHFDGTREYRTNPSAYTQSDLWPLVFMLVQFKRS